MNSKEAGMLTGAQIKDLKVVLDFVHLYCRENHQDRPSMAIELPPELALSGAQRKALCSECADLVLYGIQKRKKCPLDPKPACKKCHIHCYSGEYRAKMRGIMAYSGRRMVMRGRLDYLWHYFF